MSARRSSALRVLSALGLAAALHLLTVAPAQAGTPSVDWTTPTPGGVLATNSFTFSARVHMSSGTLVDDVLVDVGRDQPGGESFSRPSGGGRELVVTEPVTLPRNGTYQAVVRARGKTNLVDNDTALRTSTNTFTVDAPPVAPANLSAAVDSRSRVVTVSWSPNPEPDVVGYEVERERPSGGWSPLAVTDTTSVVDESTAEEGGTYRYHVRALRQSAQPGKLNPSPYSATASALVADPPATTASTSRTNDGGSSPGGAAAGGDDGGNGSGGDGGAAGAGGGSEAGARSFDDRRSAPMQATGGKVDLSDFSTLLEQSRTQQAAPGGRSEDDGTYDEKLPFKARPDGTGDGAGEDALGGQPAADARGNPQALGFLAGGLLATVLLMHVLWVRNEVHRVDALEALAVTVPVTADADAAPAPPARRRRRPPCPADR